MIRFLQGHREIAVEDVAADLTVLEYLREHRGLAGTKEGCASGDCGACTVVTACATGDGALRYQPLNACIAPLGALHGRQLITVEDLADGETLHPVQRAMVEAHASQCGFCTPGFVMSLFALYHGDASGEADILEALGGNLCRCTGYRPIVDAARCLLAERLPDAFDAAAAATRDHLCLLSDTESEETALVKGASRYFRPGSTQAVTRLLADHPDARLVAGGTDLFLEVTQDLDELPVLVDLGGVDELRRVNASAAAITIGAAVSHRDATPALLAAYPELAEFIERFGSLQIRSQGTVVGNLATASPVGDWPPVFLALDAHVSLESASGRRDCALGDFFLAYRETALEPGEYIRSVTLPRRTGKLFLRAYKISKRFEDDISSVCGVFALELGGDRVVEARVAFGGMAAVPGRAPACEAALAGLDLRAGSVEAAARAIETDFSPISDARASADYRRLVARRLLERLQAEYLGEATRVRAPLHAGSHARG